MYHSMHMISLSNITAFHLANSKSPKCHKAEKRSKQLKKQNNKIVIMSILCLKHESGW